MPRSICMSTRKTEKSFSDCIDYGVVFKSNAGLNIHRLRHLSTEFVYTMTPTQSSPLQSEILKLPAQMLWKLVHYILDTAKRKKERPLNGRSPIGKLG